MTEFIRKCFGAAAIMVAAMTLATPGLAEKPKDEFRLEPVTVSAQKREENVQDVPMSVGVISGMALEENRVTDLLDLHTITPNLFMATSGGSGTFSFVGIRGRMNNGADVDPTVTVLVDGVPYDDFFSMGNNQLFDVERIEVLRGPQSTMYGLNSSAGVINVITRKPGDELRVKAYAEGGQGPDWSGSYMLGGSISGPLVENVLRGGLAVMGKRQNGYIHNKFDNSNFNDDQNLGVKGELNWTPTGALSISGGLSYAKTDGNGSYIKLPFDRAAARALAQDFKKWETDVDWDGKTDVKTTGAHVKLDYALKSLELTSVTAFRKTKQDFDFDRDLSRAPMAFGILEGEYKSLTQEFRIQSGADEIKPYEWLAGYFYHTFDREQMLGGGLPAFPSAIFKAVDAEIQGHSHAIFGQGTYRFMDRKLGVTFGLRQEWTEREAKDHRGRYAKTNVSDSEFLPKLALDYRLTPEHMVYASLARGWRSGGTNPAAQSQAEVKYKKELSWTGEIGAKTQWMDNRLQINAAAFYSDYKDFQDLVDTGLASAILANVPHVVIMGFETDMQARLTDSLFLTAGLGYTHARYEDFPDATAGDFNGNTVAFVPDFDANIALKYVFLDNYYVRPEVQGVGNIYWDKANSKKQNPYAVVNLRAGYAADNYDIYVFGENLTNQYAFTYASQFLAGMGNNQFYGSTITPFRAGVGVSFDF